MQSFPSVAPWQHICCYYPIPISKFHHLSFQSPKMITSASSSQTKTKTKTKTKTTYHHSLDTNNFFSLSLATTTTSCSKDQENNKNTNSNNPSSYPNHQNHTFVEQLCTPNQTQKPQSKKPQKFEDKEGAKSKVILTNMWWANLKAAVGQRINLEGLACSVGVFTKDQHLVVPHVAVPDIRYIDWAELKRRGFQGVVFDKDNTLTVPYSLALWGALRSSVEDCKSVFGNNIAVFSNSAGLHEYDPDGRKAKALEFMIGIKVIRHGVKKPAGSAEEIERQFGCESSRLIMVGDRPFTDIVYGNRNGFLTILTNPFSLVEEPFIVRQVRKLEVVLVKRWSKKGFQPTDHRLLPDSLECVKDHPSL